MGRKRSQPLSYGAAVHLYFQGPNQFCHKIYTTNTIESKVYIQREDLDQDKGKYWDVFRIYPACDYNALAGVNEVNKKEKTPMFDPRKEYKFNDMLQSVKDELLYNDETVAEQIGGPVLFNSSVIIMHERSKSFLKIAPSKTRGITAGDLGLPFKLKLSNIISEKTHFKLQPVYNFQNGGDGTILTSDKFYISYAYDKALKKDLHLFTDEKLLMHARKGTVLRRDLFFAEDRKLSMQFKFSKKLRMDPSGNDHPLKALNGRLITFKHIERNSYLSIRSRPQRKISSRSTITLKEFQLNELIDYQQSGFGEDNIDLLLDGRMDLNSLWVVTVKSEDGVNHWIELASVNERLKLLPMRLK